MSPKQGSSKYILALNLTVEGPRSIPSTFILPLPPAGIQATSCLAVGLAHVGCCCCGKPGEANARELAQTSGLRRGTGLSLAEVKLL